MALESVTHISDLVPTNPTAADPKSEGDNHIRAIKTALKTDFPNINGVVSASDEELSFVAGVTSPIQAQLNDKAGLVSPAFTGTPTAPTAAAGTATTQLATTAFVTATAFTTALPGQVGNGGKFVTTDGVTASWASIPKASSNPRVAHAINTALRAAAYLP